MTNDTKTVLVTGGAGFIGSNFCRYMLQHHPNYRVVVLDALTYAGNLSTLADIQQTPANEARFRFYPGKIQDETVVRGILEAEQVNYIVNFAAESHNDRSLLDPGSFIQTDVYGVFVLLDAARRHHVERMVHISTDEVCGTISSGCFTEESPLLPNTPYSASKAGGELQARAHHIAYGTPVLITRCGNNFGPFQYPEKLLPFFITRLIDNKKVPLYGDGSQVRDWVYVMDHCSGIDFVLHHGVVGEIYNIGCNEEHSNKEIVRLLLETLGKPDTLVRTIPDPRGKAHDHRYSLSTEKIRSLGWRPSHPFREALQQTIRWYVENESWWRPIVSRPDYQDFISRFYGPYLGEDL
ncbi:dTDP-glucose 4,6-dehydratase [Chthonomonas calidirosea]|uniref:dTDP-glucose 4,6-dehydratase n=1 Tax=Chthonomonas calidirosea TaxID=454171 RepID=UPI0006DD5056|nr:dTDP-glucose 4,6-dehydratase [Chthonomonas calidirosea]CEK14866.1 dTDP-glucose 4,6-dehydratase [Chthonomonas calidirosea]